MIKLAIERGFFVDCNVYTLQMTIDFLIIAKKAELVAYMKGKDDAYNEIADAQKSKRPLGQSRMDNAHESGNSLDDSEKRRQQQQLDGIEKMLKRQERCRRWGDCT